VDVVGGRDGWERLGDMVVHGDCVVGLWWFLVCVVVM
jgi:hypothetical protein